MCDAGRDFATRLAAMAVPVRSTSCARSSAVAVSTASVGEEAACFSEPFGRLDFVQHDRHGAGGSPGF